MVHKGRLRSDLLHSKVVGVPHVVDVVDRDKTCTYLGRYSIGTGDRVHLAKYPNPYLWKTTVMFGSVAATCPQARLSGSFAANWP